MIVFSSKYISQAIFLFSFLFFLNSTCYAKYASIIMNEKTGKIYHEINADTRNYPASLTKKNKGL